MAWSKENQGFSLLELAVVVSIVAIILAPLISLFTLYETKRKLEITRENMAVVNAALAEFFMSKKRLPCPAPAGLGFRNAGFGVAQNCTGVGATVVTGALPVRDKDPSTPNVLDEALDIPAARTLDGFGHQMTYAVTERMANPVLTYNPADAQIEVHDETDTPVPGALRKPYVIVSHGQNGRGARTASGALVRPCTPGSVFETENCGGNPKRFVQMATGGFSMMGENGNVNNIDDTLVFELPYDPTVDSLAKCNADGKLYRPDDPDADENGCVFPTYIAMAKVTSRGTSNPGNGDHSTPPSLEVLYGPPLNADPAQTVFSSWVRDVNASDPYYLNGTVGLDASPIWGIKCHNGWVPVSCTFKSINAGGAFDSDCYINGTEVFSDNEEWDGCYSGACPGSIIYVMCVKGISTGATHP